MKVALAGVLLTAMAAFGADPQLLGLMMPDARVLAGLQVADSQSTPFGKFLLKQIPADAGLDNFVAATGFDPRQDLNEIVAASAGENQWLIAGRGTFSSTRIAGLAEMAGATVTRYQGADLIVGNPGGNRNRRSDPAPKSTAPVNGVAFVDSSTVLIGEVQLLKAAIDRRAAGAAFRGPLAVKAQSVSGRNQAWAATLTPAADLVPALGGAQAAPNMVANLLQSITGLTVGLQLTGTNVTLSTEASTRSDKDAQALVDVLHFVMAMAQANRKDPQTGGAATLADAATISANGASVQLTITVPEQQLESLFPPQPGVKKISNPARVK